MVLKTENTEINDATRTVGAISSQRFALNESSLVSTINGGHQYLNLE